MDDGLPHDTRADDFIVSTAILLAVSIVFYSLRLYVRAFLVRALAWDDLILGFGLTSLAVFFAMIPTQTHYGGGKHIWDLTPHDNVAKWGQAFVIAEIMYLFCLWAAKTSICILLLRLKLPNLYDLILKIIITVVTVLTLFFTFWIVFQCSPIEAQWDPALQQHATCISKGDYVTSVYVLSAVSAATDVATAIIPALVIFGLTTIEIDMKKRIGAAATLAVGSMACIVAFIRFPYIEEFAQTTDVLYNVVPLSIVSFAEAAFASMCASCVTFRPLFKAARDSFASTNRYSFDSDRPPPHSERIPSEVELVESEMTTLTEQSKRDSAGQEVTTETHGTSKQPV